MNRNYVALVIFGLSLITLGCSSGGGGSTPPPVSTSLTGTAAAGAPIIGTVTVKGALGVTKSALIEADGSYEVDVSGLTAPYRLRAQGTVGGRTYKLHSYAVEANIGGNVNITPFTDLIVANTASQIAEAFFDSTTQTELDPVDLEAQKIELQVKLQDVFTAIGVTGAIDLLNTSFSANRSGLDAVLDIVRVEVDVTTNIATITNLIEPQNVITDDLTQVGETETLVVTDPDVLVNAGSDTQLIVGLFESLSGAFANGLPTQQTVSNLFSNDFLNFDQTKSAFLTDILTDPDTVGIAFAGIVISNIDSAAGTADVTFNVLFNGVVDNEVETWTAVKDDAVGWQLRGNQRIVDSYFGFHCNDNDGAGVGTGGCGLNTQLYDEDFSNNGTNNAPIASGLVSIIDGSDGTTVKGRIYLGTPANGTAGDVQVYNEGGGYFAGDYRGFGTAAGETDSSIFAAGDIIEYALYTADLDLSTATMPMVVGDPVVTYRDTLMFAPATVDTSVSNSYPTASAATLTAMENFTLGNNLTISWSLAAGTRNSEVLLFISDSAGNQFEIHDETFAVEVTSINFSSSQLSASALSTAGLLDTDAFYNLSIRIYAADIETGQEHSRDYYVQIPGPAAGNGNGNGTVGDCDVSAVTTLNDFTSVMTSCSTFDSFIAGDLIGNSFEFATPPGELFSFTDASNGTFSNDAGETSSPITWSIEVNGLLVIAFTDFGITDTYAIYGTDVATAGFLVKAFTDEAGDPIFQETVVAITIGSTLVCNYETPFSEFVNLPLVYSSLADFEAVVADCGNAITAVDEDVIGSWVYSVNEGGVNRVETIVYDADGTAVWTETEDGVQVDTASITWSLSNGRVVQDDVNSIGFVFKEVIALLVDGTQISYAEDRDWGGDGVLDIARDGAIATLNFVKQ